MTVVSYREIVVGRTMAHGEPAHIASHAPESDAAARAAAPEPTRSARSGSSLTLHRSSRVARTVDVFCRTPEPAGPARSVEQGKAPGPDPASLWTHGALAVHLLPRRSAQHGARPRHDPRDGHARSGVRRLPSDELRFVRHTRASTDLRHQ